jgi:hypothetical protein
MRQNSPSSPSSTRHTISAVANLFPLIRQGNRLAEDELCRLLGRGVRIVVARRAGNQDSEDIAQEVLIDVLVAVRNNEV